MSKYSKKLRLNLDKREVRNLLKGCMFVGAEGTINGYINDKITHETVKLDCFVYDDSSEFGFSLQESNDVRFRRPDRIYESIKDDIDFYVKDINNLHHITLSYPSNHHRLGYETETIVTHEEIKRFKDELVTFEDIDFIFSPKTKTDYEMAGVDFDYDWQGEIELDNGYGIYAMHIKGIEADVYKVFVTINGEILYGGFKDILGLNDMIPAEKERINEILIELEKLPFRPFVIEDTKDYSYSYYWGSLEEGFYYFNAYYNCEYKSENFEITLEEFVTRRRVRGDSNYELYSNVPYGLAIMHNVKIK